MIIFPGTSTRHGTRASSSGLAARLPAAVSGESVSGLRAAPVGVAGRLRDALPGEATIRTPRSCC